MLDDKQRKFVTTFLETASPEASAILAGYPRKDAREIALDLLANSEVQEYMKQREEDFVSITKAQKMNKERLLRAMYYQYSKANNLNKVKEATDILEKIARWCGVEPDNMKVDQPVINVSNLDPSKI